MENKQKLLDQITERIKYWRNQPVDRMIFDEVSKTVDLLEEIAEHVKQQNKTLKTDTPIGAEIVAEVATDVNFPGIYLFYNKPGEEYSDRNTALLEWNDIKKQLRLCVWGDENSEDFTHEFVLSTKPDMEEE